ncbi:MAG TPA: YncE family protein [Vicinamibacterales bacterium]|nr:YncE family protein [Vicinamibacterales bacterium]
MALRHLGFIDLPAHVKDGGFDHAAVHEPTGRIYVAHTANDAIDVIDVEAGKYIGSIPGLPAVAGALVSASWDFVFTSNRGEDTVGIFRPDDIRSIEKIGVGVRPNGLGYDAERGQLLVAHVGDPAQPGSCTVSIVDVRTRKRTADIAVAGRTRWAVHDPVAEAFHVNIADPPQIVVVGVAGHSAGIRRVVPVPHAGPHGLDVDVARRRLFCACDARVLLEVHADRGDVLAAEAIAGVPDVVFYNAALGRVYVAIGDPGVIEVFDTLALRRHQTITTEAGAHTLSFDAARNIVCAFLPASHRAAVYRDEA